MHSRPESFNSGSIPGLSPGCNIRTPLGDTRVVPQQRTSPMEQRPLLAVVMAHTHCVCKLYTQCVGVKVHPSSQDSFK